MQWNINHFTEPFADGLVDAYIVIILLYNLAQRSACLSPLVWLIKRSGRGVSSRQITQDTGVVGPVGPDT